MIKGPGASCLPWSSHGLPGRSNKEWGQLQGSWERKTVGERGEERERERKREVGEVKLATRTQGSLLFSLLAKKKKKKNGFQISSFHNMQTVGGRRRGEDGREEKGGWRWEGELRLSWLCCK